MMRRTPLTRTAGADKLTLKEKTRKCKACGKPFKTFSSFVSWCSPDCGAEIALRKLEKTAKQAKKAERANDEKRKDALKTIPELKKEAQRAFNAFIRERDKDKPCICCGRTSDKEFLTGSAWDAGHYRSTGSADHLRFNEDNCHRQLVKCNQWGAGRAVDYRIGLIKRIGIERVEALESNNQVVKWTREGLLAIKAEYSRKLKELKGAL